MALTIFTWNMLIVSAMVLLGCGRRGSQKAAVGAVSSR